jgi:hypothetical protein
VKVCLTVVNYIIGCWMLNIDIKSLIVKEVGVGDIRSDCGMQYQVNLLR